MIRKIQPPCRRTFLADFDLTAFHQKDGNGANLLQAQTTLLVLLESAIGTIELSLLVQLQEAISCGKPINLFSIAKFRHSLLVAFER